MIGTWSFLLKFVDGKGWERRLYSIQKKGKEAREETVCLKVDLPPVEKCIVKIYSLIQVTEFIVGVGQRP